MKYIIASSENKEFQIEAIVSDPTEYAGRFEPIDVINGQLVAWDEEGTLYHFGMNNPPQNAPGKSNTIVYVGSWDHSRGEPHLLEESRGQTAALRQSLLSLLYKKPERSFWHIFKRDITYPEPSNYSTSTIEELVNLGEARLNSR